MKPLRFWTIWLLVMVMSAIVYIRFGISRNMEFIFGIVEKATGTLQVLPPTLSIWLPVETGEPLEAGSLIATGERSEAVVRLITGDRIRISEQTQISIQNSFEHKTGSFINILQGTIRIDKPVVKERSQRSKLETLLANVTTQVSNVISNTPQPSVVASGQIIHLSSPESDVEVHVSKDNDTAIKIFSGTASVNGEEKSSAVQSTQGSTETTQQVAQSEPKRPMNFVLAQPPESSILWTVAQNASIKPVPLQWKPQHSSLDEPMPKEFRVRVHSSQNLHTVVVNAKIQNNLVQAEISEITLSHLCPALQKSCVMRTMLLCKNEVLEEECSHSTEFSLSQVSIDESKSYSVVLHETSAENIPGENWRTQASNVQTKHNIVLSGKVLLANKHRFTEFSSKPEEAPFHETAQQTFATGNRPAIQILHETENPPRWIEDFATENELIAFDGGRNAYQSISDANDHCTKDAHKAFFVKNEKILTLSCWQIHNAQNALEWLDTQGWTFLKTAAPAKIFKPKIVEFPKFEDKLLPKLPTIAFFQSSKPGSASSANAGNLRDKLTWLPEARQQIVEASISLNKATLREVWGKPSMWQHLEKLPFDVFAVTGYPNTIELFAKNGKDPRPIKSAQDLFLTLGFHAIAQPIKNSAFLAGQGYSPSLAKDRFGIVYARKKEAFRSQEAIPIALVKSLGVSNKTAFFEILISSQETELSESFVWMEAE